MFETLDTVDWSRFHHAYGPAADVPSLLRTLVLPEAPSATGKTALGSAIHALWGNVYHQGTVWGVTPHVVPFLYEVAASSKPTPQARQFVLTYLRHLALSDPYSRFPEPFDLEAVEALATAVEGLGLPQSVIDGDAFGELPDGVDPEAAEQAGELWRRDSHRAVERGLPAVLPLLDDDDDDVVGLTIALLSDFPRMAPRCVPALWARARADTSLGASQALVALARLGERGVPEAARVLCDATTGGTALYAAIADVLAAGALASPSSLQLLRHPPQFEGECPFSDNRTGLIARVLAMAEPSAAR